MTNNYSDEKRGQYRAHAEHCASCGKVDFERPRTYANACLNGARLIKDWLEARAKDAKQGM